MNIPNISTSYPKQLGIYHACIPHLGYISCRIWDITILIVALLWVFGSFNPTYAQQHILYIYLKNGSSIQDINALILAATERQNILYHYHIVIAPYNASRQEPGLILDRSETGELWYVEPIPPAKLPQSPLVSPSPGEKIAFRLTDSHLSWLLRQLIAYSQGACFRSDNQDLETLLHLNRDTRSAFYFYWGHCAVMRGSYREAIAYYQQSIATQEARSWQAQSALAWALYQVEERDQSIKLMDELVADRRYDSAAMLALRAYLHLLNFDPDQASRDALKAVRLSPGNAEYLILNGQIALAKYEWDNALDWLLQASGADPRNAEATFYLGILYYTRADRIQAAHFFARTIQLAPEGRRAASAYEYLNRIQREMQALQLSH